MTENRVYLRFNGSSAGEIIGEVSLVPGDRKWVIPSGNRMYALRQNIFIPYTAQSNLPEDCSILVVLCNSPDSIVVVPNVDGLEKTSSTERFFWRRKPPILERIPMRKFDEHEIPVSKGRTTNGVFIPYSSFSIEPISISDDPRITDYRKALLKEIKALF